MTDRKLWIGLAVMVIVYLVTHLLLCDWTAVYAKAFLVSALASLSGSIAARRPFIAAALVLALALHLAKPALIFTLSKGGMAIAPYFTFMGLPIMLSLAGTVAGAVSGQALARSRVST